MPVWKDIDFDPNAEIVKQRLEFQKELTPISQAGVCFGRVKIPKAFEILEVTAWCRAANAAARVDVRISGVTVLNPILAPGIGVGVAPTTAVLAALAARMGAAGATIDFYLTTDAGQVMDDLFVIASYRYRIHRGSI